MRAQRSLTMKVVFVGAGLVVLTGLALWGLTRAGAFGPAGEELRVLVQREFVSVEVTDIDSVRRRPFCSQRGCGSWQLDVSGRGTLRADTFTNVASTEWLVRCGLPADAAVPRLKNADGEFSDRVVMRSKRDRGRVMAFDVNMVLHQTDGGTWEVGRDRVDKLEPFDNQDDKLGTGSGVDMDGRAFQALCQDARSLSAPPGVGWYCFAGEITNRSIFSVCVRDAVRCEKLRASGYSHVVHVGAEYTFDPRCSAVEQAFGFMSHGGSRDDWQWRVSRNRDECEQLRGDLGDAWRTSCRPLP